VGSSQLFNLRVPCVSSINLKTSSFFLPEKGERAFLLRRRSANVFVYSSADILGGGVIFLFLLSGELRLINRVSSDFPGLAAP
jgi:hypothetical protein